MMQSVGGAVYDGAIPPAPLAPQSRLTFDVALIGIHGRFCLSISQIILPGRGLLFPGIGMWLIRSVESVAHIVAGRVH